MHNVTANTANLVEHLRQDGAQEAYATEWRTDGGGPVRRYRLTLDRHGLVSLRTVHCNDTGTPSDIYYRSGRLEWTLPDGFSVGALSDYLQSPEALEKLQAILNGWSVTYADGRGRGSLTPEAEAAHEAIQADLEALPGPFYELDSEDYWYEFIRCEAPSIAAGQTTILDVVRGHFGDAETQLSDAPEGWCVIERRDTLRVLLDRRVRLLREEEAAA